MNARQRIARGVRQGSFWGVFGAALGLLSYLTRHQGILYDKGVSLAGEFFLDLVICPLIGAFAGLLAPYARSVGSAALVGAAAGTPFALFMTFFKQWPASFLARSLGPEILTFVLGLAASAIAGAAFFVGWRARARSERRHDA